MPSPTDPTEPVVKLRDTDIVDMTLRMGTRAKLEPPVHVARAGDTSSPAAADC